MLDIILSFLGNSITTSTVWICEQLFFQLSNFSQMVENNLPALSMLDSVFVGAGTVTVICSLYFRLTACAAAPITGQLTERPLQILSRAVVAQLGVCASSSVCKYIMELLQFLTEYTGSLYNSDFGHTGSQTIKTLLTESIPSVSGGFPFIKFTLSVAAAFEVLHIFIKSIENLLLLTLLSHISPLYTGMLSSPSSADIFASFARAYFGQCVSLLVTSWGMKIFILSVEMTICGADTSPTLVKIVLLEMLGSVLTCADKLVEKLGFRSIASSDSVKGGLTKIAASFEAAINKTVDKASARAFPKPAGAPPIKSKHSSF